MKSIFVRYRMAVLLACAGGVLTLIDPDTGCRAFALTGDNILEMLSFLPPIFVLLGLLDVWVDRETMMKYMGEQAGLRGNILAFLLGSAAAGPLYAAFPIAGVMLKKQASMLNIFIFIGAWSTTKVPLIMFETATLGFRFMALRLLFNIAGIVIIAKILHIQARKMDLNVPAD